MKEKLGIVVASLLLSGGASADVFTAGYVAGNACSVDTTSAYEENGRLRVGLNSMAVDMPYGSFGDGLTVRKSCTLRFVIAVPDGQRLASVVQSYRTMMTKSTGVSARLAIRSNVGGQAGRLADLVYGTDTVVSLDDGSGLGFDTRELVVNEGLCGGTATYGMNLSLVASRQNLYSEMSGGLALGDSALEIEPVFEACN